MFRRLEREASGVETGPSDRVSAFYRFHIGEHEITVINDGFIGVLMTFMAVNAPEGDVQALTHAHGLSSDYAKLPIGNVLVRTGGRVVLVDTGAGTSAFAESLLGDYIGGLAPTLELIGVSPEAVTDVIFSHVHVDHVGGTSSDGRLAYPNAQHHLPELEWEDLRRADIPEAVLPFYDFARDQLRPLGARGGQLALYGDEDELVPGITAVATPGHSAGHHALLIGSGSRQLLLPFDVLGHHVLHLQHPEWYMAPDHPEVAVETRQRLLARAADEEIPVLTHHFPFPGLGRILRDGDAYRYQPTS